MPEISIASMIPDADNLLALEPEELAGVLLEHLNSHNDQSRLHLNNFLMPGVSPAREYPFERQNQINEALTEAWVWLEREGLIAPRPGAYGDFLFITRRGKQVASRANLDAYRHANLFPRNLVHPVIAQKVYPAFLRGEYDTAVFQAYREVEVAVRAAGNYTDAHLGVPLMRAALNPEGGPLTDPNAVRSEQEAISHLFAGAIGLFKNPTSHRTQQGTTPASAVERILLASQLLRIVDSRASLARL